VDEQPGDLVGVIEIGDLLGVSRRIPLHHSVTHT
jgi:hypothetical protein